MFYCSVAEQETTYLWFGEQKQKRMRMGLCYCHVTPHELPNGLVHSLKEINIYFYSILLSVCM